MVHGRICARSAPSPAVGLQTMEVHIVRSTREAPTASSSERSKPRTTRQQIRNVRRSPCLPASRARPTERNRRARSTRSLRVPETRRLMTTTTRLAGRGPERESLRAPARFQAQILDADEPRSPACDSKPGRRVVCAHDVAAESVSSSRARRFCRASTSPRSKCRVRQST